MLKTKFLSKKTVVGAVASVVLVAASASALAAGPAIDFSKVAPENTDLGPTYTLDSVTADAFTFNAGVYATSRLWERNNPSWSGDQGLGVCSEGDSKCVSGGGDVNELDNIGKDEVVRLTMNKVENWSNVFISSLDTKEMATVYWSNNPTANLDTITTKTSFQAGVGPFSGGKVLNSIMPQLTTAGFDVSSKYLFFRAGGPGATTDNDYLVWGVTMVPEPETYAMLMAGLGLMGVIARRRKQQSGAV